MYKVATLNKISPKGLAHLNENYQIVEDAAEANGILLRSTDIKEMEFSKDLLCIARAGAGVNNIPVDRCAAEGIVVFNTPGANANAVKELVLGALLMAARNLPAAMDWARALPVEDGIAKAVEKGKGQFAGHELAGKTLGVIGLGAIGNLVANACEELGMTVIGYDPYLSVHAAHMLSRTVSVVDSLEKMLPYCDYLSIHVPAMDSTNGMINADCFAQMKPGVAFLNYSRDKLVDEDALLAAIEKGTVRAYYTDFANTKVAGKPGVFLTPHLGASTEEAEENCAVMAVQELMDYIENGNITNSVNFPACSLGPLQSGLRIVVLNKNVPSMLGKITGILAEQNINIGNLNNRSRGNYACTLVDVDSAVDEAALRAALNVDGIISVRLISR
jgi:D-3-phosphoglycerate dehydrogenase